MLRIALLSWDEARAHAAPVRVAVFVDEQGVPREIELDEMDPRCVHVVAFDGERPVATGRLLPDGRIGRMAVLKQWRGRGIGSFLLKYLVQKARERGNNKVSLSAQVHAVRFYKAHGFEKEGGEYLEAGIRHQAMRLRL